MSKVTKLHIHFKHVQFTRCQLYLNNAAFKNLHYNETAEQNIKNRDKTIWGGGKILKVAREKSDLI